jgi:hypothetical protein
MLDTRGVYTRSSSSAMAAMYDSMPENANVSGESATEATLPFFSNQPTKLMSPSVWDGTDRITLPEVVVVTVILLLFEYGWTFRFLTRNENPRTGGEKESTNDPNVARNEFWFEAGVATTYRNTPSNLQHCCCASARTHVRHKLFGILVYQQRG